MPKCLVLFVEGYTEVEFYKEVIEYTRKKRQNRRFDTRIACINVKGVGRFKSDALRKFIREIKPKCEDKCKYTVVFCSDMDVEMSAKPPIDWGNIKKRFLEKGVKDVIFIKAEQSIEDWFLYDEDGIKEFLGLPKKIKLSGKTGYEKLSNLFKQANKVYLKGEKSCGLIAHLNMELILGKIYRELVPLYKVLGVKLNSSDYKLEKRGK